MPHCIEELKYAPVFAIAMLLTNNNKFAGVISTYIEQSVKMQ